MWTRNDITVTVVGAVLLLLLTLWMAVSMNRNVIFYEDTTGVQRLSGSWQYYPPEADTGAAYRS